MIAGIDTGLNAPSGIAVDSAGNIYVANDTNTITVYHPGANGNTAPTRTISGSRTGLIDPDGLAFDAAGNLYVANGGSGQFPKRVDSSITVYATSATDNASPIATISGSLTGLNNPNGIALDACGTIYVTSIGNDSVIEFASGSNGNVLPISVINGVDTGLKNPFGIVTTHADVHGSAVDCDAGSQKLCRNAAELSQRAAGGSDCTRETSTDVLTAKDPDEAGFNSIF